MAKQQLEYQLQKQVCAYLNAQYPNVMYLSDTIASCKLTILQAVRNKAIQKDGFKCPDLIILEPKGDYHGLMIELKIETPFKKDGKIYSNEHLIGQQKTITNLINKGYFATFSVGFDEAKKIIDNYMKDLYL
jgi:hypothetical protein